MKPDYIKHLEQKDGIYSELDFPTLEYDLVSYLDQKKLKRVYENSGLGEKDKIIWYYNPSILFIRQTNSK